MKTETKPNQLTDSQRAVLSQLMIQTMTMNLERDPIRKLNLAVEVKRLRTKLKRSMGTEAYNRLITQGRRAYGIKKGAGHGA